MGSYLEFTLIFTVLYIHALRGLWCMYVYIIRPMSCKLCWNRRDSKLKSKWQTTEPLNPIWQLMITPWLVFSFLISLSVMWVGISFSVGKISGPRSCYPNLNGCILIQKQNNHLGFSVTATYLRYVMKWKYFVCISLMGILTDV